jgi:uncharacterized membrane protein
MDEVRYIWRDLRLLIHDHLRLATLETKLVAESLVSMVATSVAVVLLLVTAWLGLISAGVVFMVEMGLPVSGAILIAVVFNVVIALLLGVAIRRQVSHLQWPATLRSLRPSSAEPHPQQSMHDQRLHTEAPPSNVTRH